MMSQLMQSNITHSFISPDNSAYTQRTSSYNSSPLLRSISSGFLPILSGISKACRQLLRYHSMMLPCAKRQALERAVYPPEVCQRGSHPSLIKSQKISMLPTAAAQCRAPRPFRSRILTLGLQARMALARLSEEMEAESMRRVCPAGVRGVLSAGRTWWTKEAAACGEHWFICMHCSQTWMGEGVPDGAARCWAASSYYKLIELTAGGTLSATRADCLRSAGGSCSWKPWVYYIPRTIGLMLEECQNYFFHFRLKQAYWTDILSIK